MAALTDLPGKLRVDLEGVTSHHELDNVKSSYLGAKSAIRQALIDLGKLDKLDRAEQGKAINLVKSQLEKLIAAHKRGLDDLAEQKKLDQEAVDTTLHYPFARMGAHHPLTLSRMRLQGLLEKLGFTLVEGDDIETKYYNFTALNTPEYHPATTVQDTFYVDAEHLLRSHTSCVQIKTMEKHQPPLRIFSPGRVFRADTPDATHSPCFMQCEGLVVDKSSTVTDLEATLRIILEGFFGQSLKMRFRPSYFPFTEPSFECDIWFKGAWLEVLGCGMVHPFVLDNVGIDPDVYQGFAFGMGIDRLTMLYYGIEDIRCLYDSDVRFLQQFR